MGMIKTLPKRRGKNPVKHKLERDTKMQGENDIWHTKYMEDHHLKLFTVQPESKDRSSFVPFDAYFPSEDNPNNKQQKNEKHIRL